MRNDNILTILGLNLSRRFWRELMKIVTMLALCVVSTTLLYAKETKSYQTGTLLQMEAVECGSEQKGGSTVAGEVLGTDSTHQKTHVLLCQEYVLQTDSVTYHIRPKDEKHPSLLPVSSKAEFRLSKDKMKLRLGDDKERDYVVVSMTPREAASSESR